ncbi:MAG: DUF4303 domain-containing protein [Myxococcales bacterium]|nr:DUF4303 domain-containing protein [Myxococcales bacterium]
MSQPAWPEWLQPAPSFTRDELRASLLEATRVAWLETLREHEHETFYVFGLATSDDDLTLKSVAASKQGLRRSPSALPVGADLSEETMHRLRWLNGEWPYQQYDVFEAANRMLGELREKFDRYLEPKLGPTEFERRWDSHWAPLMREISALYVDVLRELDARGGFVMQPSRVMLAVFGPDCESTRSAIRQLNPAHQADRCFRDLSSMGPRQALA